MNVSIIPIQQSVKIKQLFNRYKIEQTQNAFLELNNQIMVLSPTGYKNVNYLFRTQKQQKIKILLQNGQYIICGIEHQIYCIPVELQLYNTPIFKKAKDIEIGDSIAVKNQNDSVYFRRHDNDILYRFKDVKTIIKIDKDEQILYDMQVDQTHEYFANGILSHNSWFLAGIGAEALKQNKKVLHYTLQLADEYTYMRYDSILSGIPFQKLILSKDRVKQQLQKYQQFRGNLRVKYYPTKTATVGMLLNHIKQCELILKFKPDVIIIDYADLLKPQHIYDNSYHTIGDIYLSLRGMAGILEVPIWSASQINRCFYIQQSINVLRSKNVQKISGKQLKQNDMIETPIGFKKVNKVYPVKKQPTYQIKLKNGQSIKCSCNHSFPLPYGIMKSIQTGLVPGDKLFVKKNKSSDLR